MIKGESEGLSGNLEIAVQEVLAPAGRAFPLHRFWNDFLFLEQDLELSFRHEAGAAALADGHSPFDQRHRPTGDCSGGDLRDGRGLLRTPFLAERLSSASIAQLRIKEYLFDRSFRSNEKGMWGTTSDAILRRVSRFRC
jgi:hypothetical protein